MAKVEWSSYAINDSYHLESNSSLWNGRIYKIIYKGISENVITKPLSLMNKTSVAGYAYFETTELILKLEAAHSRGLKIYNRKNLDKPIGHLEFNNFWFHNILYNVDIKTKTILNKAEFDLTLKIKEISSPYIAIININVPGKNWYHPFTYSDYLEGCIHIEKDTNWEFVLSLFFYLDHYLDILSSRD